VPEERLTTTPDEWVRAVSDARDRGYVFFDWLSAVDETDAAEDPGVEVVCHLIDPASRGSSQSSSHLDEQGGGDLRTVLLRTRVPEGESLASITGVFAGAAWHERETHEMFGVAFDGFTDSSGLGLRPLLLPAGFEGTPLRKSFVLASRATRPWPGGKEPGEGHGSAKSPSRRRVQAPGVPGPEWGAQSAEPEPADG
jgi:NADH-quinone oxidoreductase subunit C